MLYFPVCLSHPQYPDFKISQSGFNVKATTSITLPELTWGREPIAACMDHDLGSSLACPIHPGAQAQTGAHKKTRLQQCCCLGTTRTAHHMPKPLPKALQEGFRRGDLFLGSMWCREDGWSSSCLISPFGPVAKLHKLFPGGSARTHWLCCSVMHPCYGESCGAGTPLGGGVTAAQGWSPSCSAAQTASSTSGNEQTALLIDI